MNKIRLESINPKPTGKKETLEIGVHTPSIIAWAKSGFTRTKDSKLAYSLAEAFGVKPIVMIALLTGEVDYTVEDDAVVFNWPDDPKEVSDE